MRRTEFGFTLVELMVAMLLGLVITGAALQLFLSNQQTFRLQKTLSGLEEDGQMVLRYLAADLRNAGRGDAIIGVFGGLNMDRTENGANGTSDTISVQYLSLWDCQGSDLTNEGANPEGQLATSTYYVENETLFCDSDMTAGTTALLSGIESVQFMYGVDRTTDGELGVTNYVTADGLTSSDVVVAVRMAMLLRSDDTSVDVPIVDDQEFQVLDEIFAVSEPDRALRRIFTNTVHLRNFNWETI